MHVRKLGTLYRKFTTHSCLFENLSCQTHFFLIKNDSVSIDSIHSILEGGIDLFASGAPVCVGKMRRTDLGRLIEFSVRIETAQISTEPRNPSLFRNESNPRWPALSGLRLLQSFVFSRELKDSPSPDRWYCERCISCRPN